MFTIPKGDKLRTLKRGFTNAMIYNLQFNINSTNLLVSSNSGTVHVYDLKGGEPLVDSTSKSNKLM